MAFGKKLSELPEKASSVVDADLLLVTDSADGLSKKITGDKLPEDPSAKWLDPVRVRTTANVNLAGGGLAAGTTHDGIELDEGDRVLTMVQDDATEVGIYLAPASGAASRASDLPVGAFASLVSVLVDEGDDHEDTAWICTTNRGVDEVGTDDLAFAPFPSAVSAHASTHVSGGGDQLAGCDLACGQSPANFTPSSATIGGMVQGIDTRLGILGAQAVTVDPTLDHASANEVGYGLAITVNKAAGNYIAERTTVTETAAPGAANKLREWLVGATLKISAWASGAFTVHNPGTAALPALEVDYGSGGKLGVYAPAANTIAVAANAKAVVLDGGSASALTPLTDALLGLGTAALKWGPSFISKLVAAVLADASDLTKTVSFVLTAITTGTNRTITMPDANVDLQYARAASATIAGGIEIATLVEANAGIDALRAMTPYLQANLSPRVPVPLTSSGVGTYTVSDAAVLAATGFWVRQDFAVDQQDAAADSMAYTIGVAEAGSVAMFTIRLGQTAVFSGSGVTLVANDQQDGTPVTLTVTATDTIREAGVRWINSTYAVLYGGDV